MILVTLRMIVKPEKRSDLLETMRGMLEPVRVERNCLSYRLYEDVEDNNAFVLLDDMGDAGKSREPHLHRKTAATALAYGFPERTT